MEEQSKNHLPQTLRLQTQALSLVCGYAWLGESLCPSLAKCCLQPSRYREQEALVGMDKQIVTWHRLPGQGKCVWQRAPSLSAKRYLAWC